MKKLVIGALVLGLVAFCITANAGTLYDQEGIEGLPGTGDGTLAIDASTQAPAGSNAASNWKYQYGGGTWAGVYAGTAGWVTTTEETGDMNLEVEADIEMYFTQTVSNNKIYFHIGNIYAATLADLTAYVDGSFSTNNGMYVGISFDGTTKSVANFEKDGTGKFTGKILGGMVSKRDSWRAQDNEMDIEILLNSGAGWEVPVAYGDGSHNTIHDTLWWLVNGGAAGSYNYQWRVRLLPVAHQADGDYYLDPVITAAPVL